MTNKTIEFSGNWSACDKIQSEDRNHRLKSKTESGRKILYYSERFGFFFLDENKAFIHLLPKQSDVKKFKMTFNPIEIDLRKTGE